MTEELAVYETSQIMPAAKQVEQAQEKAKILQDIVNQAGLAKNLGGKKAHLEYEAWVTIAAFYGCTPIVEWTRLIEYDGKAVGYEAKVNIVNSDNRVISSAEAMCTFGEANWRNKPIFQLRSMAQTRAGSKAARMVFSWVAVLAGYSPTPYEEMTGEEYKKTTPPEPVQEATEEPEQPLATKEELAGLKEALITAGYENENARKGKIQNTTGKMVKELTSADCLNIIGILLEEEANRTMKGASDE